VGRAVPVAQAVPVVWMVRAVQGGRPPNMVPTPEVPAATLRSETQVRVPARLDPTSEAIPLLELQAPAPDRLSSGPTPAGQAIPDNRTDVSGEVGIIPSKR
jgi:hypothetical protein